MLKAKRQLKILDFDIETRPLSFWYDGKPTAEITVIASCWANDMSTMQVHVLGEDEPEAMLTHFVERYDQADIVTGHYIRMFDLPMISGALLEYGFRPLSPKLTIDTKNDLIKKGDIPATQEFLGELLELPFPKVQMSQVKWRKANRLSPEGIQGARERATGDVYQHMALRLELAAVGALKQPKVWRP
jgi:hypothetical protein